MYASSFRLKLLMVAEHAAKQCPRTVQHRSGILSKDSAPARLVTVPSVMLNAISGYVRRWPFPYLTDPFGLIQPDKSLYSGGGVGGGPIFDNTPSGTDAPSDENEPIATSDPGSASIVQASWAMGILVYFFASALL
jgi:hypothetical protein